MHFENRGNAICARCNPSLPRLHDDAYMTTMTKRTIITVQPRRAPPVLVCRKCLKRAGDGRAIRRALKAELKVRSNAESKAAITRRPSVAR